MPKPPCEDWGCCSVVACLPCARPWVQSPAPQKTNNKKTPCAKEYRDVHVFRKLGANSSTNQVVSKFCFFKSKGVPVELSINDSYKIFLMMGH